MRDVYRRIRMYHLFAQTFNPRGWMAAHGRQDQSDENISVLNQVARHADLIKDKGFTHVLPTGISPIGRMGAKGYGSPYAIKRYRGFVPEMSTREDIGLLREKGLPVIMDTVFNHSSHDLASRQPELYLKCSCGGSEKHEACRNGIHCGGYWQEERAAGINKRRFWTDTAQFNLTDPRVWKMHRKTIAWYRRIGAVGSRLDGAQHLLRDSFQKTWGKDMSSEFLAELIQTTPDWLWIAECYSPHIRDLVRIGCITYDTPECGHENAWPDALATHDPVIIQQTIQRVANKFNNDQWPMPLIDCGTNDHPAPRRRYANFLPGAAALTLLAPCPVLFLAGDEGGHDGWPHDHEEAKKLFEIETVCRPQPLSQRNPIEWGNQGATAVYQNIFTHCRNTVNRLDGKVTWDASITNGSKGWVGYAVRDDNVSYVVLANPTQEVVTPRPYPRPIAPGQYLVVDDSLASLEEVVRASCPNLVQDLCLKRNETGVLTISGQAHSHWSCIRVQQSLKEFWPVKLEVDVLY